MVDKVSIYFPAQDFLNDGILLKFKMQDLASRSTARVNVAATKLYEFRQAHAHAQT